MRTCVTIDVQVRICVCVCVCVGRGGCGKGSGCSNDLKISSRKLNPNPSVSKQNIFDCNDHKCHPNNQHSFSKSNYMLNFMISIYSTV